MLNVRGVSEKLSSSTNPWRRTDFVVREYQPAVLVRFNKYVVLQPQLDRLEVLRAL